MKTYTDKELLDFLQDCTNRRVYTGRVIFRWSSSHRGWRLHESSLLDAIGDVREAISMAKEESDKNRRKN